MSASTAFGAVAFALIYPAVVITAAGWAYYAFGVVRAFYKLVKNLSATVAFKIKYRHLIASTVFLYNYNIIFIVILQQIYSSSTLLYYSGIYKMLNFNKDDYTTANLKDRELSLSLVYYLTVITIFFF